MLTRRSLMRFAAALPVVSANPTWAFGSKDFWETKASADWNSEEVDRMITKSPWAKEVTATSGNRTGGPGNRGGGRSGGGIGFPGGGIGFPRGGGGGYPGGGGGGYPGGSGGGGYPGGGRGGGDRQVLNATVRWESALPVQEALRLHADDEKPDPDFEKYYVIALVGDLPSGRGRRYDDNSDDSANDDPRKERSERRMEAFKNNTRLERKDGPLHLEKVDEGSRTGGRGPGVYFYFSRNNEISMDDKEVDFSTKLGPREIKAKFTLKDMRYHGKLAL